MTVDDPAHPVDALIVTAVKEEWNAVLLVDRGAMPGSLWHEPDANWPAAAYRWFTSPGGVVRIAVVQSFAMGKEHAAAAAAMFLERHPETRCLAMCGVCAGRRGDVALGDVIIADRAWPYDAGKLKIEPNSTNSFQGDIDLYRIHPPEWKQRAERFRFDLTAPWVNDRPRSYEDQGDWILSILLQDEDPKFHPARNTLCPRVRSRPCPCWAE